MTDEMIVNVIIGILGISFLSTVIYAMIKFK